jgi:hypothetical protein
MASRQVASLVRNKCTENGNPMRQDFCCSLFGEDPKKEGEVWLEEAGDSYKK